MSPIPYPRLSFLLTAPGGPHPGTHQAAGAAQRPARGIQRRHRRHAKGGDGVHRDHERPERGAQGTGAVGNSALPWQLSYGTVLPPNHETGPTAVGLAQLQLANFGSWQISMFSISRFSG